MVLQTLFALVVMVAPAQADVELFGRPGCAHCARAEHFLDELVLRMPDIAVVKHDVSSDKDAEGRLKELAADAGIKRLALPTLAVRGTLVIGFDDAQTTGAKVVALLEKSGQGAAFEESGICGVEPVDCADPEANAMVLPVFGRVELESLGLPVFTLLVGLVDGFNPCAMWVLLFLLSLLVNLRSRTRMALIGGVFVVVSGVVYFAFMAAWLNIFLLMALSRGVQIALGIVAITASSIHIKDAILPGHGPSLSIPDSAKPGIYARVRRIVLAENTLAALAATGTLAVAVNFVELLCTAGLPAIYTQILSRQELSAAGYYAYLGFYNVAYMADDALMLGVAITTLSRHRLQEGGGRWLKLVSGVVMAVLGLALIFKPELLTWP